LSSEQSLQRERNISREPQLFQVQNLPSGTVVPVPLRTHIKSPFVFLYLAHLPLQNVKTKQNMVPEVAPYYLGAEPAGYAQLSLAHKLGPAPNHSGGQVGSDG